MLEAMRRLEGVSKKEPGLVKQLYDLALLNRDEAVRRIHAGMSEEAAVPQRPPSLLSLSRPPEGVLSSKSFRPAALTRPSHAAANAVHRPRHGPRFGSLVLCTRPALVSRCETFGPQHCLSICAQRRR